MLRFLKQLILIPIEYCFKLAAPLAALISMAAQGGFANKVAEGFQSLPEAIREILWWFSNISEIGTIIDDYNTMTAANFNQKYGAGAINSVMEYLNEGVVYLQRVYANLAEEPLSTILAAFIVFAIFYLAARLVRFIRQEGQGSVVDKMERRAGNRVFKNRQSSNSDHSQWA